MTNTTSIPKLDEKGLRKFAFTMAIVISVLFGIILPYLFDYSIPKWPWLVGLLFIIWGAVLPNTLSYVYYIWMRFGLLISKITTPLIIGILFFLIITPMALLMKIFKNDPLTRKFDKSQKSYRINRDISLQSNFEKPY